MKTVGIVNHFYDIDHPNLPADHVEQLLSQLEGAAHSAVIDLVQRGANSITDDQRVAVATFVAAQFLRGEDQQHFGDTIADALLKATC